MVTICMSTCLCRLWVGRVGVLVGDRNAEIRRAACQALHLVYTRMDGPTLLTHIAHASPPEQVSHHKRPVHAWCDPFIQFAVVSMVGWW